MADEGRGKKQGKKRGENELILFFECCLEGLKHCFSGLIFFSLLYEY